MKTKIVIAAVFCLFFSVFAFAQKKAVDVNSKSDVAELKADAEKGDRGAQYELSMVYAFKQDMDNSVKWLKKSAENGFAKAQYTLSSLYKDGSEKIAQNAQEAFNWLEKSAESGYAKAQYELGAIYYKGSGAAKQSYEKALRWLQASKDNNFVGKDVDEMITESRKKTGEKAPVTASSLEFYSPDTDLKAIEKKAKDDAELQYDLAVYYRKNGEEKKSVKWYNKAVSKGHLKATLSLAAFYFEKGVKTEKNGYFKKSVALFEKAGDGIPPALQKPAEDMMKIGRMKKNERAPYIEVLKKGSPKFQ